MSLVRTNWSALTVDRIAVAMFVLVSVVYFAQAIALAASAPLWMDEVLTVWTARQPDVAAIWSALLRGAEFTPPLYDLFIHALNAAGITGVPGLRLPSIIAIYIAAIATGLIVRRHAALPVAAMAAAAVLSGGLFGSAVQIRSYALVTAAFACALALYDRPGRPSNARLAAIALLLGVAIGLHFYALLLAMALAVIELVSARVQRRAPSWRTLGAIGLAASSILLWLPLVLAARAHSGVDVGAPDYYGRPTLWALINTYGVLLGWLIVPMTGLLAAFILGSRGSNALRVTACLVAAIPIGIFAFAVLVSHSYAARYSLAGGVGVALVLAFLTQQLGVRASQVALLIMAWMLGTACWRSGGEIASPDRLDALAAVASAPAALPIVTGDGLRFLEIRENLDHSNRLIFLNISGVSSRDPTNRNQVMRWKTIDPALPVADAETFVCSTSAFYLFAQPLTGGTDELPGWLAERAEFEPPPPGRASLTLVRMRPCAEGPQHS